MRSCRGCRHLRRGQDRDYCAGGESADDWRSVTNPYSGRREWAYRNPHRRSPLRPTLAEARAEGGVCGPDATLYEPTLLRRALGRLGGDR